MACQDDGACTPLHMRPSLPLHATAVRRLHYRAVSTGLPVPNPWDAPASLAPVPATRGAVQLLKADHFPGAPLTGADAPAQDGHGRGVPWHARPCWKAWP